MKIWMKGAIVGAVWGLISFIPMAYCAFSDYCNTNYPPLSLRVISFPVYFGSKIFPEIGLIGVPISILIGALIGGSIGCLYDLYRGRG